ncbi:MAG: hypothetical protein UY96_C0036G0004 [Parcubacteria group bacterium GW2011_GWB1_56_8]|nr:MAG: hypothetical protein UY96_C0036G0004 [Parcubacteria group bacterium GW2011_GWB1_56_8]
MSQVFFGIAIGAVVALGAYVTYVIIRRARRRALFASLSLSLFLIKIPRETPVGGADADIKAEVNRFEQLVSNLAALKTPVVFEVAVPHIGEEIHFYVAVPKHMSEVMAKQVQGLWNGASVESVADDYNIFHTQGVVAAAYFSEKEDFPLPLRTYRELDADPLASILGGFARVNAVGEGAALQIMVRPAPSSAKKKIRGVIAALRKGGSPEKIFGHKFPFGFSDVAAALNPKDDHKGAQEKVVDEAVIQALQAKMAKPLFEVNVRLLASAVSAFQANDIIDGLAAGFTQLGSPDRNELKAVKPRSTERIVREFVFRTFEPSETMVLSSEEIASIYHFPITTTETPRVVWLKAKEAAAPANLPDRGTLIGESVFRGDVRPVHITDDDRRRHLYMIGQTGTGKSTLLGNMIIEDIQKGRGVAMIDPHGELVESVLGHIPEERVSDVIYFDPSDLQKPLGLNMLDYNFDRPEEKTFIVNEMQGIFNKLFPPETMGPMFEQYMRNALLLLMEDMPNEPATLIEVPRVFTDPEFRKRKLNRIVNPVVLDFWEKEAVKAGGEASLANMTPYITSKFNNFISNDYMRPIIGQQKSAFNFREVMDQGKILLVNLSKGRIGDINAGLLGMVFTGKILMAALSRAGIEAEKRRDFHLYIDEFQNFTTDSIASILSEARKYRLSMTIAHQFIAQLAEPIRDAVFGNVGSEVVFRVGVQDAEFLAKQFAPTFDENDLMNIDNLNAYAKILIHGETSRPFNIRIMTTSWAAGDPGRIHELKDLSRATYGRDRQEVEEGIHARLRE